MEIYGYCHDTFSLFVIHVVQQFLFGNTKRSFHPYIRYLHMVEGLVCSRDLMLPGGFCSLVQPPMANWFQVMDQTKRGFKNPCEYKI